MSAPPARVTIPTSDSRKRLVTTTKGFIMKFMNELDRTGAIHRFTRATKPNRLALALLVDNLATWADNHSDGWAYWRKPAQSAQLAIALIESTTNANNRTQEVYDVHDSEVLLAARPVKAFCTRQVNLGVMTPEDRELILRAVEDFS